MVTKCQYYLPQKKRNCSFAANPGTLYCGNHLSFVTGTEERVPCPFDPAQYVTSASCCSVHPQLAAVQSADLCQPASCSTIRVQDLKGHEFKCPSLLQRQHDQVRRG